MRSDSYYASLFDALKQSLNDCSNTLHVEEVSLISTPDRCFEDALSTCSVHVFLGTVSLIARGASSIIKSAKTCGFTHILVIYSMSYSLSYMAHLANRPDWLGLCSIVRIGCKVITTIVWDWK